MRHPGNVFSVIFLCNAGASKLMSMVGAEGGDVFSNACPEVPEDAAPEPASGEELEGLASLNQPSPKLIRAL